ncbi:MAG: PCMD domain-containing protein [Bacteroidales bacterium]|nr:PCMD domain-containing protein [Bacteroidales bacterium]
MKTRILSIAVLMAGIVLGTSCTKDARQTGNGALSLRIEADGATKAAMSQDELLAAANVKIYKADFSGKVREYTYSQMPASIYLPADSYRVDVAAGEIAKAAPAPASWEQKSYKGSADVTIVASQNSNVTVAARICNTVTRFSFDASIAEMFNPGYSCTVGLSETDAAQQLVYTADKSGTDGYFIADGFEPSLYWSFSGTLAKDGSSFTKSGEIPAVESGKRYAMSLRYSEKDGLLAVEVEVDDSTNDIYDDIIFIPVATGIASTAKYEIWAGHFTAHADVDEKEYDSSKVYFEWAPADSDSWTRVSATRDAEGAYSGLINGLTGSTEYKYRLVVTSLADGSEEIIEASSTITTDAALQAPNSSFETTSNTESKNYSSFFDPASLYPELQKMWWDSGNKGSTAVGASGVICYPVTDDVMHGTTAVCLQSRYVVIKFAAGNLFSGHFGSLVGTSGGTVFFGRPFTARPTAMRLWMKYSSGKINRITNNAPAEVKEGDYDKASLRIAIGTWDYKKYGGDADSPVLVNTTDTKTFVDYNTDESTIAVGELFVEADASNSTDEWRQVTIPLTYKDLNKYPTHIIISFAASMYGDYFTGYDNSRLWLDGIELLYE